jgi:hypothetical protein
MFICGGVPEFEPPAPRGVLLGLFPLPGFTVLGFVLLLSRAFPSAAGDEVWLAFGLPAFALVFAPPLGPIALSCSVGLAFDPAGCELWAPAL